jgi:hypothetical protein
LAWSGVAYGFTAWKECGPLGTEAMHAGSDETVKGEFATPVSEPVFGLSWPAETVLSR